MRSLNFAINSSQNVVYEIFVKYLFDAGHNLFLLNREANTWDSNFISKLKPIQNINDVSINYLIGFGENNKIDIDISDKTVTAFIQKGENIYVICTVQYSIEILKCIENVFIDTIIFVQRELEISKSNFVPRFNLSNISDFYVKYDQLKNFYAECKNTFYLPHVKSLNKKLVKIKCSMEHAELFICFLLYLFNARKKADYVYDIIFENVKIKKVFGTNEEIYNISKNPLYVFNFENSEVLITDQPNTENYRIKVFLQSGGIGIEYEEENYFFDKAQKLYDLFKSKITRYYNKEIDFYNLSLLLTNQKPITESIYIAKTLLDLFYDSVDKNKSKYALIFRDKKYSYSELDKITNGIAHHIKNVLKIPDGSIIGIKLPRSDLTIIAIISVFKARCVYLPIDSVLPSERLDYIIQDSKPKFIIESNFINDHLQNYKHSRFNIESNSSAYIIYTSGSTGNPKGVIISHQSLLNTILSQQNNYLKENQDFTFGLFLNCAFDASLSAILLPLTSSNTLVVAPDEKDYDINYVINFYKINATVLTASMLSLIDFNSNLKLIITGGEQLNSNIVAELIKNGKNIIQEYGLTETTIACSYKKLSSVEDITIGIPIKNMRFHILDDQMNDLPNGVVGNLYISGTGLASGYVNNKENYRFVNNMYNTGDLVKKLKNKEYEYCGRNDNQIKINGHRIELSEIDQVLLSNSFVRDCCTISDNNRIISYIVRFEENSDISDFIENWNKIADIDYTNLDIYNYKFNTIGWVSSYNNLPIPAEEMVEWINNTIDRILQLNPKNILEIGCGSGLIMFNIINKCQRYYATDFSKSAIDYVNKVKELQNFKNLSAYYIEADKVPYNDIRYYDCVVINSVVQYFPNISYFESVLFEAIKNIANNGKIFIGDVRNYDLIEEFYKEIYKHKGIQITLEDSVRYASKEKELLISPSYFYDLQTKHRDISHVEILTKNGKFKNEMNEFRYDVVLHIRDNNQISINANTNSKKLYNNPLSNFTLTDHEFENGLVDFLKKKLPDYMIPDCFILIGQIPLNRNGKINKQSLLEHVNIKVLNQIIQPQTELEKAIALIWGECLSVNSEKIGLNTNFFDIGGDSLTAIKIVNAINKKLSLSITFSNIIEDRTISKCIERIQNNNKEIDRVDYEV
jgi:amino acid adenylation domain-containing protein